MKERRYEIKFTFPINEGNQIKTLIKGSNLGFNEIFKPRKISSIYLDTINFKYGFENIRGFSERKKFRFRFYDDDMKKIRFEIKSKKGNIYEKKIFNLDEPFSYPSSLEQIIKLFRGQKEEFEIKKLLPVLFCSYIRNYYISSCNKFRITFDFKIGFSKIIPIYSLDQILNNVQIINNGVLEFKTSLENFDHNKNIFDDFPLRVSKNSKYETGLSYTHCIDPKNFF